MLRYELVAELRDIEELLGRIPVTESHPEVRAAYAKLEKLLDELGD
jgi:hypothetical protein